MILNSVWRRRAHWVRLTEIQHKFRWERFFFSCTMGVHSAKVFLHCTLKGKCWYFVTKKKVVHAPEDVFRFFSGTHLTHNFNWFSSIITSDGRIIFVTHWYAERTKCCNGFMMRKISRSIEVIYATEWLDAFFGH